MPRILLLTLLAAMLAACSAAPTPTVVPSTPTAQGGEAPSPTQVPIQGEPSAAPRVPMESPGFTLNEGPATVGCDTIGLDYERLTWRIDPSAAEAVTAVTDLGGTLRTYWAPGFTAGGAEERVVRGPDGAVVVEDGDELRVGDRLHGYFVCLAPERLHVLTQAPQ